jgi:hypothetical protein
LPAETSAAHRGPLIGEATDRLADATPEGVIFMDEKLCVCERWVIEVAPGEWAHEDDMLACTPAEPLPLVYVDEMVV